MKIALIQMSMSQDPGENLQKSLQFMEQAAGEKAELVLFPELQLSPFFPQYRKRDVKRYELTLSDQPVQAIGNKARELNLVTIANVYLREKNGYFDACPVFDADGELKGVSHMVHIVQIPQFYEQDYYQPGEGGFKVYNTAAGNIGVVICYDRHYPESIRSCVLQQAQLVAVPTAIISGEPFDLFEWEVKLAAWQNNVFIAMCNRVGREDEMQFCGNSLIIDPDGNTITKAGQDEEILYAEINYDLIPESRRNRPFLALRRPDFYR